MDGSGAAGRPDRHPGETYGDILDRDSRAAPAYLREGPAPDIGLQPIAASRYFSREFFDQEARYLWPRVWQMACREEDIPAVGDCHVYENLGKSLIVVRTAPDTIKALVNSCLHRGRKLVTHHGCRQELKCPFHGITWNIDGTFKENPIAWDFPQWEGREMRLPEARVETWGGFVFINFDPAAASLSLQMKPIADHFVRFDWQNRYRSWWVQKKVRCNWKAAAEAFMESHHSVTTHPQILGSLADANSQYDILNDWVSRQFSATGVPSPFMPPMTEQEVLDHMTGRRRGAAGEPAGPQLAPGETARRRLAETARQNLSQTCGYDYSQSCDAEMLDALLYNLFPNFSVWAGEGHKLAYRWRPLGLDPNAAIMDIMVHAPCPKGQPRPKPAAPIVLEFDDKVSDVAQPGQQGLAAVFDQDFSNLPYVQEGLLATRTGEVHLGRYTEMRIRHLHHMIDRYLAEGAARAAAPAR